MKKCNICTVSKPLEDFHRNLRHSDGRSYKCKVCVREYNQKRTLEGKNKEVCKRYSHTKSGYLHLKYGTMKQRVEGRGGDHNKHIYEGLEILVKKDFLDWALTDPEFIKLWNLYCGSDREIKNAPSIDRIDNSKGYTLDNIQFITMSQNSTKAQLGRWEKVNGTV